MSIVQVMYVKLNAIDTYIFKEDRNRLTTFVTMAVMLRTRSLSDLLIPSISLISDTTFI